MIKITNKQAKAYSETEEKALIDTIITGLRKAEVSKYTKPYDIATYIRKEIIETYSDIEW